MAHLQQNFCLSACLVGSILIAASPHTSAQTAAPAPLTLEQAVSQVLAANPATRIADTQLVQAQARLGQAQAQRRFRITFDSTTSGSNASLNQPPPAHESFGTLQNTLTVPIPLGARPGLVVRQAQAQISAFSAQRDAARLALSAQTIGVFYDVLRRQALLLVAQQTLAQSTRAREDARKRFAAGDVPELDVLQAQVPEASALAALDGASNDLEVARQALNSLLGRPLDAPLTLADVSPNTLPPLGVLQAPTLAQAQAQVLANSPNLRVGDAALRAAEAGLQAIRLYREPTLSLQAIDIRSNDRTSFSRLDTVQATVSLPLSDGGLGRAQVREAEALLAEARARNAETRRVVLAGVSTAYLTAQSQRRQVAAAKVALDIAQITYDKTVLGYRSGLFPQLQVLTAQTALTQARIAYTQAVYGAGAAAASLSATLAGAVAPVSPALPPVAPATPPASPSPAGAGAPTTSPAGNPTTGPNAGKAGGQTTP